MAAANRQKKSYDGDSVRRLFGLGPDVCKLTPAALTQEQFNAESQANRESYIKERLNLIFYDDLVINNPFSESPKEKCLIGFVARRTIKGKSEYFVHPINCLSEEFIRGILFSGVEMGLPVQDTPQNRDAAARARGEEVSLTGKWMVAGIYDVTEKAEKDSPSVIVTELRILTVTPKQMQERIRSLCDRSEYVRNKRSSDNEARSDQRPLNPDLPAWSPPIPFDAPEVPVPPPFDLPHSFVPVPVPEEMRMQDPGVPDRRSALETELKELEDQRRSLKEKLEKERGRMETELGKERKRLEAELDKQRKSLEWQRKNMEGQRETLKKELETVRASLKEEQAKLAQEKSRAEEYRKALRLDKVRKLAEDMKLLGFDVDTAALGLNLDLPSGDGEQRPAPEPITDLSALTRQVQNYLAHVHIPPLYYEEHVIREFLGAMFSGQLIILSGPPGTGKSSLPPAIAEYIGAKCCMVSVQPSWTDNQDLLGFYDPTRDRFVSTPFMDILAAAREDKDVIYLVCLDEMNLVRVEYYFSEILSAMETADKELRLYSRSVYQQQEKALTRQVSALQGKVNSLSAGQELWEVKETLGDVLEKLEALRRCETPFPIPKNVQFVGTLNMDESTRELSPKVLDRSFIIEIGQIKTPQNSDTEASLETELKAYGPSAFQDMRGGAAPERRSNELEEMLAGMNELGEVSASLSRRGQAQVDRLFRRGLDLDDIFLGKILPVLKYAGIDQDKLETLKNKLLKLEKTRNKLDQMYDPDLRELNFWYYGR